MRLSAAELERGLPLVDTVEAAARAVSGTGWVLFENAFEPALIERMRRAFFTRYGALSEADLVAIGARVGHERYMFAADGELFDPDLYGNPMVLPIVRRLLGDDCVIDSYALVVAYPGAEAQHLHLDHSLLFPEDERTSLAVPPYAITLVVPLVDLGERTGSTRLFDRGARAEPSLLERLRGGRTLEVKTGAAWLMDYRLAHGGTANPGQIPRPILYVVYARKWFVDAENFRTRPPLPEGEVPAAYRALFTRVRGTGTP